MTTPGEHKTVQARILTYAEAIGWKIVSREDAERRRGIEPQIAQMRADESVGGGHLRKSVSSAVKSCFDARASSLYFNDLLDPKIGKFRTLRGSGWVPDLLTFLAYTFKREGVQG